MRKIFSAARVNLLSMLPVTTARRLLHSDCAPASRASVTGEKQLLVDVSALITDDARTGIQRVVRSLLLQLLRQPPAGFRVRPVFATRKQGYRYAPEKFGLPGAEVSSMAETVAVKVGPGDFFLGLDLAAHLLPSHKPELAEWKRLGAEIHIIVYDLLPVLHPRWFKRKRTRTFHKWLKTIAIFSDSIICISHAVKTELEEWFKQQYALEIGAIPVTTIPLGADIQASAPSRGLPGNIDQLLNALGNKPTILMVGTLEPRKGHSHVLAAFEQLWDKGCDINLVIVGKAGWKTGVLQKRLLSHPQGQTRLHWLDKASDELLELLYTRCTGVIVASQAEGFGLPLIEAMHHNKPVLARDIPVFREIGGSYVTFFSNSCVESFMHDIEFWINNIDIGQKQHSAPKYTWQDCTHELLANLGLRQSAIAQPHQGKGVPTLAREGIA